MRPAATRLAAAAAALGLCLAAAGLAAAGTSGAGSAPVYHGVDRGLCRFPLGVTVATTPRTDQAATTVLQFAFVGPVTVTLRDVATGKTAVLRSSGDYTVDTRTGGVAFRGRQVWFWSGGGHVPFLATDGPGRFVAPYDTLAGTARALPVDPCALVAPGTPSTRPLETPGPWGLPRFALRQIAYAGLTPILGTLVRHDHVHVDLIVNGRRITIPAGVGQAEPRDSGPCPAAPLPVGDCATGHVDVAQVANSPLHTHSTSGIIHIESDRPGTFTLGQFFDEWGVRLTVSCVGGYCSGGGRQLRVYVDGRRAANPRAVVLGNRQEIAVVFGGPDALRSVPAGYRGGWPGLGCGGSGESPCLPRGG
jgi:hypothetical protein